MNKQDLLSIIQHFRTQPDPYLFVEASLTEEDFKQFTRQHQLLLLEETSGPLNSIYWTDSVFLLWDEELMTLELFKDLEALKLQLRKRQTEDNLAVFVPLPLYLNDPNFKLDELINAGDHTVKLALADNLSVPVEQMDFSEESLRSIDQQVKSQKIDDSFVKNNLIPLSVYLGETYLNIYGGHWQLSPMPGSNRPVPMIKTPEGRTINMVNLVYAALTRKHGALILPTGIIRAIRSQPFTPQG